MSEKKDRRQDKTAEQFYTRKIEQIYEELGRAGKRARKTVQWGEPDSGKFSVMAASTNFTLIGAMYIGAVFSGVEDTTVAKYLPLVPLTLLPLSYYLNDPDHKERKGKFINVFLGLAGRSLPMNKNAIEDIQNWAGKHPRLVEVLGRWTTERDDGELNLADHSRVQKKIRQLEGWVQRRENHAKVKVAKKPGDKQQVKTSGT